MKKLLLLFSLLLILGMCGCSYYTIGSVESNTPNKFSMTHVYFDGTKEDKINVKKGKTVNVSVNIVTKEGSIDAYIYKDKDRYVYKKSDIATSKSSITLSKPGKYTIKVKGRKHKGSYSFTW